MEIIFFNNGNHIPNLRFTYYLKCRALQFNCIHKILRAESNSKLKGAIYSNKKHYFHLKLIIVSNLSEYDKITEVTYLYFYI